MKIALVSNNNIIQTWTTETGELSIRYELPDGAQISPVVLGWESDSYSVKPVQEFSVPAGKRVVGQPSYVVDGSVVVETYATEDIPAVRRLVRKSVVQARLIEAGLMGTAYNALTANPVYFARWFAPDQPAVYFDDPDALTLLAAIGADPEIIMAEE